VARRRVLVVGAAAALIGPVAYLDIAYGLHGGDKPLTDYMFQVGLGVCWGLGAGLLGVWWVGDGGGCYGGGGHLVSLPLLIPPTTPKNTQSIHPSTSHTHTQNKNTIHSPHTPTHPPTHIQQTAPVGVGAPLIAYVVFKFLVTALCVCLPLPVGLFTPTFVTGGAIGRLFGEALHVRAFCLFVWVHACVCSVFIACCMCVVL
jgi:H+/Cl- antiporter ClcA